MRHLPRAAHTIRNIPRPVARPSCILATYGPDAARPPLAPAVAAASCCCSRRAHLAVLGGVSCARALGAIPQLLRQRSDFVLLLSTRAPRGAWRRVVRSCPQHQLPLRRSAGFVLLLATSPPRGPWRRALRWSPHRQPTIRSGDGSGSGFVPPAAAVACTAAFDTPALQCLAKCPALSPQHQLDSRSGERRFHAAAFEAHASRCLAAAACCFFRRARLVVLGGVSCASVLASAQRRSGGAAASFCALRCLAACPALVSSPSAAAPAQRRLSLLLPCARLAVPTGSSCAGALSISPPAAQRRR